MSEEAKSLEDLLQDIDALSVDRARFIIKALLVAQHVGRYALQKSIELAEVVQL